MGTRSSVVAYEMAYLCSLCISQNRLPHSCCLLWTMSSSHDIQWRLRSQTLISSCLIIVETSPVPKMSVTALARNSNPCRYAWRTGSAVTTWQIARVIPRRHPLPQALHIFWPWLPSGSIWRDNDVSHTADADLQTFRSVLQTYYRFLALYTRLSYTDGNGLKAVWFRDTSAIIQVDICSLE